ncbi:MAG: glycosyltransferase family 4 protein [Candidatus Eiseniibacteriota bacterium]|nr:MAG: glycosyltransferase family 4 protein [Candidatus Eisenbacteria bacterium]
MNPADRRKSHREPKRICMVAYTHYRSDPRCRREAEAFVQRGDEVDFVCLGQAGDLRAEEIGGVRLIRHRMRRYRGDSALAYLLSYAAFFARTSVLLLKLHLRRRFDVVYVHSLPELMVFVALLPRLLGAKVVLDLHELSPELYADRFNLSFNHPMVRFLLLAERICVRWVDGTVLCTHPQAERLLSRCSPRRGVSVVMNVPDPELFPWRGEKAPPSAANGVFRIVHHGTLVQRNGVDVAIRAFGHLDGDIPGAELSIYGSGDFLQALKRETELSGVSERVHISGEMLPVEAIAPAICDAQVGVVPNMNGRVMELALPTKLIEYVALGIPAVASRTPAVSRYFDESMVMFFEPGNASDLAGCIVKLYREPELGRSMTRNAMKFLEEYSWDKEKQKLFSVIDGLET